MMRKGDMVERSQAAQPWLIDKAGPRLPQYIYSLPVSVSHAFKVNLEPWGEKKRVCRAHQRTFIN